jgi:hypothetical protein
VRRPAALLGLLVASSALAGPAVDFAAVGRHVPPVQVSSGATYSLDELVRGEVRSVAGSTLFEQASAGTFRTALTTVGKRAALGIAYSGAAFVGVEAINWGLKKFYDELKSEASGDLATCFNNDAAFGKSTFDSNMICDQTTSSGWGSFRAPIPQSKQYSAGPFEDQYGFKKEFFIESYDYNAASHGGAITSDPYQTWYLVARCDGGRSFTKELEGRVTNRLDIATADYNSWAAACPPPTTVAKVPLSEYI